MYISNLFASCTTPVCYICIRVKKSSTIRVLLESGQVLHLCRTNDQIHEKPGYFVWSNDLKIEKCVQSITVRIKETAEYQYVVSFNADLSQEHVLSDPLTDGRELLAWLCENGKEYPAYSVQLPSSRPSVSALLAFVVMIAHRFVSLFFAC